jgi:hypothetical protein
MEQQHGVAIFVPSGSDFAKYNYEDLTQKFECTSMIYSYTSFGANIAPRRTPFPLSAPRTCSMVPVLVIDRHGLEPAPLPEQVAVSSMLMFVPPYVQS